MNTLKQTLLTFTNFAIFSYCSLSVFVSLLFDNWFGLEICVLSLLLSKESLKTTKYTEGKLNFRITIRLNRGSTETFKRSVGA